LGFKASGFTQVDKNTEVFPVIPSVGLQSDTFAGLNQSINQSLIALNCCVPPRPTRLAASWALYSVARRAAVQVVFNEGHPDKARHAHRRILQCSGMLSNGARHCI